MMADPLTLQRCVLWGRLHAAPASARGSRPVAQERVLDSLESIAVCPRLRILFFPEDSCNGFLTVAHYARWFGFF